jgi:hypothetical protein
MPMPSSMTFEQAAEEVLARIGQLDDGVANPLLVAEAKKHINAAQRKLIVEHGLQGQRRLLRVSVAAGRRFADLPSDCRPGQVRSAVWVDAGGEEWPLACGFPAANHNIDPMTPCFYDMTPTVGVVGISASGGSGYSDGPGVVSGGTRAADGHDPVVTFQANAGAITGATISDTGSQWTTAPTIAPAAGVGAAIALTLGTLNQLELNPIPSEAGTLVVEYQATVTELVDDADELALDAEAVIGRAAILLAITKGLSMRQDIERDFVAYMQAFRPQQSPGRTVSLSAWRRDDGGVRQALPRQDARRA